jgi:serine/threonine-protein kinase
VSGQSPKVAVAGVDTSKPAAERYRIVGRIASGGMAEIYLARMLTTSGQEREVVLKRLMPELQGDHEFVQMFHDEARIASQMRHPNIVQIFELGELDGSLFISMELLRGINLRDLLARLHRQGDKIPIPLAVRIACGALEALSYAHRFTDSGGRLLNVVHRDVSPQNIIVTYEGMVKLVDFGVAKAEGRLHQTRAGLIKGKFAYMSPEQISGGKVDGRSDLFALAEVFYELMLLRHPFFAKSDMEVLRSILDLDPPHPSQIDGEFPPELGAILIRALRKSSGDRYANAAMMHDALENFLQQQRAPVTTIMLGRYVRELFDDRVEMEQRARESGDERLLIEAMAAGKAELPTPKKRGPSRSRIEASKAKESYLMPAAKSSRNQVVEIARSPSSDIEDPAERGAPAFIAHSGYTDPGTHKRRFRSQVRQLFNVPSAPTEAAGQVRERDRATDRDTPSIVGTELDAGELPTVLGHVDDDAFKDIREARVQRDRTDTTAPKPTSQPKRPIQAPSSGPTQKPISSRGRTVIKPDVADPPSSVLPDRWGLMLFVGGLGALIGAIAYAIVLYASAQSPVMRIEVRSTPVGASILFDGVDTAAQTPTVFQNVDSSKEHTIELRLQGYEPHTRVLPPSPELGELIVNWSFKPNR